MHESRGPNKKALLTNKKNSLLKANTQSWNRSNSSVELVVQPVSGDVFLLITEVACLALRLFHHAKSPV